MNQLFACLIGILLFSFQTKACSCSGPRKFIHSISELTVEVEIIGRDSIIVLSNYNIIQLSNGTIIQDGVTVGKGKHYLTLLKINKLIHGKSVSDTLYLVNDSGVECFHSVPDKGLGKQYILTGNFENPSVVHAGDTLEKYPLFYLNLCLENIIILRDGKVLGNVTRNKVSRIAKQSEKLGRINRRLGGFYYNHRYWFRKNKERYLQKMSKRRFYRLLKRHCDINS